MHYLLDLFDLKCVRHKEMGGLFANSVYQKMADGRPLFSSLQRPKAVTPN